MRKLYILLLLCAVVSMAQAQKITRNYKNQSLSRVLEDLNAATNRHEISFVYNDLENFTVTCKLEHLNLGDALIKVVGFYPVHIVRDGEKYFVSNSNHSPMPISHCSTLPIPLLLAEV